MPSKTSFLNVALACLLAVASLGAAHASLAAVHSNPLENADFEQGVPGAWDFCGGARLVDAQAPGTTAAMVHGGRYALRLGQPIDDSCFNDALGPSQVAFEDVTIPSDASDVTVEFWYSALGTWSPGEFQVNLSTKPHSYLGSQAFIDSISMDSLTPGWHLYRTNLRADQVASVRGKTLYLQLYVRFKGDPSWDWSVHIDDIRVLPRLARTQAAPLPADLRGNSTRPLVLFGPGTISTTIGVHRMDTDGSNRVIVAEDRLAPRLRTWSPDGRRIAYATDWLEPEVTAPGTRAFSGLIGRVYVMNADGSDRRPIHKSLGGPGVMDEPRGCVGRGDCPNRDAEGSDALDGLITGLTWSPDGTSLGITYCSRLRWYNSDKASRDASCHVTVNPIPQTGITTIGANETITRAVSDSWHPNGRILYGSDGGFGARFGLRTRDSGTGTDTALASWLTGSGSSLDLRGEPYLHAAWSPDGERFASMRKSQSVRYMPGSTSVFGLRANNEIMLHERLSPNVPRMLLLVDHGDLGGRLAWSPDGKYILYSVTSDFGGTDVWWLNVSSGETGRVTNDGVSFDAQWRPGSRPVQPPGNLTKRVSLPAVVSSGTGGGATPQPGPTPFAYITRTPIPTATPLPPPVNPTAVPPRGISGRVTYNGAPIAGINIHLESCVPALPCAKEITSTTNANGEYGFPFARDYSGFINLRPTYRNGTAGNNPEDPRFLLFWQGNGILGHDYAERVIFADFDIAEVPLISPANGEDVALPATFQWGSRGIAGEVSQWFINAPGHNIFGFCDQSSAGTTTTFTFTSLECDPLLPLQYDETYSWSVAISRSGAGGGAGQSHSRNFQFVR